MAEPRRSKSYNDIDEQRARINHKIIAAMRERKMSVSEAERRYNNVNRIANRYLANIERDKDYQRASWDLSLGRINNETAYRRMFTKRYGRQQYMKNR